MINFKSESLALFKYDEPFDHIGMVNSISSCVRKTQILLFENRGTILRGYSMSQN